MCNVLVGIKPEVSSFIKAKYYNVCIFKYVMINKSEVTSLQNLQKSFTKFTEFNGFTTSMSLYMTLTLKEH